jgi:predicted SnoaL-like aldol condensation-catalyzing enzyme
MRGEAGTEAFNKEVVLEFFEKVLGRIQLDEFDALIAQDYLPHLPEISGQLPLPPGRDALKERILMAGPISHQIYRVVADGDLVYAHVRYEREALVSGADIFRLDVSGRICEHWSARQAIPDDGAKGIDRFSGGGHASTVTTSERREKTRRIALEVMDLWRHGNADLVSKYYDEGYIQHNPDMPGGSNRIREIFATELKAYIANTGGPFPVDCHRIGVEGDLIFVHYSVPMAGINRSAGARSTNIDIFRINAADLMAEHWDVLQINGEGVPDEGLLF